MARMTRLTLLPLLLSALSTGMASTPASTPYSWRNVRIDGGGFVTSTIFSKTVPGLVYARTDMGGAYILNASSPSAEPQWLPLQDSLGWGNQTGWGTLALASDSLEPNRVYLATGLYLGSGAAAAAVYSSDNYGSPGSWVSSPLPIRLGGNEDGRSAGERLAIHPRNNSILYLASSQNGLWGSHDKGKTWGQVATFPNATASLMFVLFAACPANPNSNDVFVGVKEQGATNSLLVSHDAGLTWGPMQGAPSSNIPYRGAVDAGGKYVFFTYANAVGPNGMSAGAVWRLDLTSYSWTDVTPSASQGLGGGFAGISTDAQHPGTLVVTSMDRWWPLDEIYRSTDAGMSWVEVGNSSITISPSAPWIYWHRSQPSYSGWMGDIAIDPFNSDRAFHTTGQGLWMTIDLTLADKSQSTTWSFSNYGLEQTVALELVSPPSGAPLVSALGDIDGFRHDNLDVSPTQGMFSPSMGSTIGLDVAWLQPNFFVRSHAANSTSTHGSWSDDGGYTFHLFPSEPPGAGEGPIAVSADARVILWYGHYSLDNGTTWTASGGYPNSGSNTPIADKVNPSYFYVQDKSDGTLYSSNDGGRTFAATGATAPSPAAIGPPRAVLGVEGDLWLPSNNGLYYASNHASVVKSISNISIAYSVGIGAADPSSPSYPCVYVHGVVGGEEGFFRSCEKANSFLRINSWDSQFGFVMFIQGDARVFGRAYVATNGRGILVGEAEQN